LKRGGMMRINDEHHGGPSLKDPVSIIGLILFGQNHLCV